MAKGCGWGAETERERLMKLTTIALAAAFTLPSTFALAYTNHHRSGVRTHHPATYDRGPMNSYDWSNNGWNNYGRNNYGPNNYAPNYNDQYGDGPNNRPGLVGGDDNGT
jgi:hypothetical protein